MKLVTVPPCLPFHPSVNFELLTVMPASPSVTAKSVFGCWTSPAQR